MAPRRDVLVRGVLVVAVTASLGLFAAGGDPPPPPASAPAAAPAPRPEAKAASLRHDLLRRETQQRPEGDAFAAHSWQPPPPPPPPVKKPVAAPEPVPEPPPAAPPLPFTFVGAFETEGAKQVFYLAEGDKVHAVTEGEIINEAYQIETVTPEEMVLVYLPLKIKQTLALGGNK